MIYLNHDTTLNVVLLKHMTRVHNRPYIILQAMIPSQTHTTFLVIVNMADVDIHMAHIQL